MLLPVNEDIILSSLLRYEFITNVKNNYWYYVNNKDSALVSLFPRHKQSLIGIKKHTFEILIKSFIPVSHIPLHKVTHNVLGISDIKSQSNMCNKGFTVVCHFSSHKLIIMLVKKYNRDMCNKFFISGYDLLKYK